MKRYAVIAALAMGVSFPVLADDKPPGKSQPLYSPRLADIMVATQLRHFKLWYAGQVKNWPLANYELAQIRATFDDTTRLYPDIPAANMTTSSARFYCCFCSRSSSCPITSGGSPGFSASPFSLFCFFYGFCGRRCWRAAVRSHCRVSGILRS